MKVLGTPLGHPEYVRAFLWNSSTVHRNQLERIPAAPDLQGAWLVLLFCAGSRANYLLRVVLPDCAEDFATEHGDGHGEVPLPTFGNVTCPQETRMATWSCPDIGGLLRQWCTLASPSPRFDGTPGQRLFYRSHACPRRAIPVLTLIFSVFSSCDASGSCFLQLTVTAGVTLVATEPPARLRRVLGQKSFAKKVRPHASAGRRGGRSRTWTWVDPTLSTIGDCRLLLTACHSFWERSWRSTRHSSPSLGEMAHHAPGVSVRTAQHWRQLTGARRQPTPSSQVAMGGPGWSQWSARSGDGGPRKLRSSSAVWPGPRPARQAWRLRWATLLACSTARAFAFSLLGRRGGLGSDGATPSCSEDITEGCYAGLSGSVYSVTSSARETWTCSFSSRC